MAPILKTAGRLAWSSKRQTAFGTPLAGSWLDRFILLREPLVLKESLEHWSDRGMIGSGHDWETSRGLLQRHVEFELPEQPLPVDFAALLIALFFCGESSVQKASGAYEHAASFPDLQSVPESPVTTFAVREDGQDWFVQDIACTRLTLSGEGPERMKVGAAFVGTRTGALVDFTWPETTAQRYLYNYAGAFSLGGQDRRPQLRSFKLALESGLNLELAWHKAASELDRIYPAAWPLTPERKMDLALSLVAEPGDLSLFRTARADGSWSGIVLSVLGETIPGTSPADSDSLVLEVPRGTFTALEYEYGKGLLGIDLSVEGRYESTLGGPLRITTTEGSTSAFMIE